MLFSSKYQIHAIMKKRFNLHFGYLQTVVLLTTFSLLFSSCIRHTKNQDELKISTQTKKQNSKKIHRVAKKAVSKKTNINVAKNDTILLINKEFDVVNQREQETQIALDSMKVTDPEYTDSTELESFFAELEKVEVDSSDFVLIEDY